MAHIPALRPSGPTGTFGNSVPRTTRRAQADLIGDYVQSCAARRAARLLTQYGRPAFLYFFDHVPNMSVNFEQHTKHQRQYLVTKHFAAGDFNCKGAFTVAEAVGVGMCQRFNTTYSTMLNCSVTRDSNECVVLEYIGSKLGCMLPDEMPLAGGFFTRNPSNDLLKVPPAVLLSPADFCKDETPSGPQFVRECYHQQMTLFLRAEN